MRCLPVLAAAIVAAAAPALAQETAPPKPPAVAPAAYVPTSLKPARDTPRTRDGHPDLQGVVWDAYFFAPLQASQPKLAPTLTLSEAQARKASGALIDSLLNNPFFKQVLAFDPEFEGILHDGKGFPIVRGERRSRLIVLPADGKLPLTAEGAKQGQVSPGAMMGKADNPEDRSTMERCISMGANPPTFFLGAPIPREFVVTGDAVVIHSETGDELRVVPFASVHGSPEQHLLFGDSIARWEGDTLVIETIHHAKSQRVRFTPAGVLVVNPDATVIERFTRISREELIYQFTVLDPKVYAAPWLAEYSFFRAGYRMFPGNCHEGNYGLPNILAGAREEERATALAKAGATPPPAH